jgi:DNA-binding NtrC family response regulator
VRWNIILTRCEGDPLEDWHNVAQLCGARLVAATSDHELIQLLETHSPKCAVALRVCDVTSETLRTVEQIRGVDETCPVLVQTSSVGAASAVAAMRAGASDILDYSASAAELAASFERISGRHHSRENRQSAASALAGGNRLLGNCAAISEVRKQIARAAASDSNVLITGESGTGKELVAELIHRNSPRNESPFVAVNCAAIPESLLESELFGYERGAFTGAAASRDGKLRAAGAGTLFLDEIGDMPLTAQAKILRAIENRVIQRLGSNVDCPVLFRVVAATNQDLEQLTRDKRFRHDLYFRLNVVRMELPPLRERCGDIPELADNILRDLTQRRKEPERRLEDEVMQRLQRHSWPGNVRELRNVLESILVYSSSSLIGLSDLPGHISRILASSTSSRDERSKIVSALTSTGWNRDEASKLLHCSRMTLYRKMLRYSIPPARD